jgi:hypothetical protein
MKRRRLKKLLETQDLHANILRNYEGRYALGVVSKSSAAALQLRVEPRTRMHEFASFIILDGEKVPVLVTQNLKKPFATPLGIQFVFLLRTIVDMFVRVGIRPPFNKSRRFKLSQARGRDKTSGVRSGDETASGRLCAPEELRRPFAELAEALLHAAGDREVIFLQNCGNYGDSLIRYGTIRFFEDIGLRYREFDMMNRKQKAMALWEGIVDRHTDQSLFVYSGSGAWSYDCTGGLTNVHRQFAANPNIFVLPTTFQYFGLPGDIPVFVRDRFESWKVVPQARFCHDMAFYLALVAPDRLLANRVTPSRELGLFFRTDNEARDHGLASLSGNVDISALGIHSSDPREFLRMIDQFSIVATDRLHVAIGATLLGKRVLITEGNYFKIRAVFNSSMKGIFDNCELIKESEMYALADSFNQNIGANFQQT